MGFDLDEDVGEFLLVAVAKLLLGASGTKERHVETPDDAGVVGVSLDAALGMGGVGVANHLEEGALLRLAVDDPGGIEDLVAAMLGVDHREHHQLDVGRIAPQFLEDGEEIVDLLGREGQTHLEIGTLERLAALRQQGDVDQWPGLYLAEQDLHILDHRLGHAVVEQGQDGLEVRSG